VFQHGRKWIEAGMIIPHNGNEPVSAKMRVGRSLIRSIKVPESYVSAEVEYDHAGTPGHEGSLND
jgi:hypothetical protein